MKVIFFIVYKCGKCRIHYKLCAFKKNGKILKKCRICRNKAKIYVNKKKCIHDKQKHTCKLCGGSNICIHNKQKPDCKLCNDPVDITIKNMVRCGRRADKKSNKYDELNFVDYLFVKNLINNSNDKCYYCSSDLQYTYYTSNLGTIERLDNNLGHIKSNCVIACRTCNLSKIGNQLNN